MNSQTRRTLSPRDFLQQTKEELRRQDCLARDLLAEIPEADVSAAAEELAILNRSHATERVCTRTLRNFAIRV